MNIQANISVYDPFRAQLAELRDHNASLVFDYEDPKGNKDARSHIYQLRRTKTAIDNARKDAGKAALEYKRKVDSEGNEIIAEVDAMIQVHKAPLDEIEARERAREERAQEIISDLISTMNMDSAEQAGVIQSAIDRVTAMDIDDSYGEYREDILRQKNDTLSVLRGKLAARQKHEAEQEELKRLRQEAAERERLDREEKMKREAAEQATRKAEEKARAEQERIEREKQTAVDAQKAAERRAKEAEERQRLEADKAEQRRQQEAEAAERRAKEQAEEATRQERERIEDQARRLAEANHRRAADSLHRAAIHREILADLIGIGVTASLARQVVESAAKGRIRNIRINY